MSTLTTPHDGLLAGFRSAWALVEHGSAHHLRLHLAKGLEPVSKMLKKMFRGTGPVFDYTNYRAEWQKACNAVGLGVRDEDRRFKGLRIHDLRCSAAINLVDAGVAEDTVMKIGGWKTKAMFSRYNVMNTDRIRKAMVRGGNYVAAAISSNG